MSTTASSSARSPRCVVSDKGRVYADLAQTNGEMCVYNIQQACDPTTVWPEWNEGEAVKNGVEAWHFASRLTSDEIPQVLAGLIPRVDWTPRLVEF